jgi:hypothetical protein
LFPKSDIEIVKQADLEEARQHITLRPTSSTPDSASEGKYKMVYSEASDNEEESRRSFGMGGRKSQYSEDEYSGVEDQSGYSRNSALDESAYSNTSRGVGSGGKILPNKMAKRQQQKLQKGKYSGEESVFAK